jgi:hypothetical protein
VSAEERTIRVAISRDDGYAFLKELAENDDVRAKVEANPGRELEARGIVIPEELLPARARLASKEQIAELMVLLGDDPEDKLGRPKGEAWVFHMLCFVFMFGALPFVPRDAERDGPP